jgi:hypothetical protein
MSSNVDEQPGVTPAVVAAILNDVQDLRPTPDGGEIDLMAPENVAFLLQPAIVHERIIKNYDEVKSQSEKKVQAAESELVEIDTELSSVSVKSQALGQHLAALEREMEGLQARQAALESLRDDHAGRWRAWRF